MFWDTVHQEMLETKHRTLHQADVHRRAHALLPKELRLGRSGTWGWNQDTP